MKQGVPYFLSRGEEKVKPEFFGPFSNAVLANLSQSFCDGLYNDMTMKPACHAPACAGSEDEHLRALQRLSSDLAFPALGRKMPR